eukprot:479241-Amphidinium_carterae.1
MGGTLRTFLYFWRLSCLVRFDLSAFSINLGPVLFTSARIVYEDEGGTGQVERKTMTMRVEPDDAEEIVRQLQVYMHEALVPLQPNVQTKAAVFCSISLPPAQ